MKIKDIEGALSLIAAFKNADWVEEHLKALLEAKVVADKAIADQKVIQADVIEKSTNLGESILQLQRQSTLLDQRERNLKAAQEEWRLVMAGEQTAISRAKSAHNALVEETKQQAIQQAEVLDKRSKELDQRERVLSKRELAAVQKDEALSLRDQSLMEQERKHAERVIKLRELTA